MITGNTSKGAAVVAHWLTRDVNLVPAKTYMHDGRVLVTDDTNVITIALLQNSIGIANMGDFTPMQLLAMFRLTLEWLEARKADILSKPHNNGFGVRYAYASRDVFGLWHNGRHMLPEIFGKAGELVGFGLVNCETGKRQFTFAVDAKGKVYKR